MIKGISLEFSGLLDQRQVAHHSGPQPADSLLWASVIIGFGTAGHVRYSLEFYNVYLPGEEGLQ